MEPGATAPSGPQEPRRDAPASAAATRFTPAFLAVYDVLVLGLVNSVVWECPSRYLLALYDKYVSTRHLDVGVGTGYFLDHCRFPSPSPAIALLDVNPHPLRAAARRVRRYRPRIYEGNVLEPLHLDGERFDSIGLSFLLHCLPGRLPAKGIVFQNLKPLLNEGGVVFGSTLLGTGVRPNALARRLMARNNQNGIFSNLEDDPAGLEQALAREFSDYRVQIKGCVALFAARH